jgi:hypothetical protein
MIVPRIVSMALLDDRERGSQRSGVAPGEGERRAQRGLVPQYKVAAEKIYALLTSGRLYALGIADPEADTLDDIQVIRSQGAQLILDAYQVKWSGPGETLTGGNFTKLLEDLVSARKVVVDAAKRRARDGSAPVDRVTAHLYTSRAASTARLRNADMRGSDCSLHGFLDGVWWPAQHELVRSLEDVDSVWHPFLVRLASACALDPDALLALAPDLRIETGRELEEDGLNSHDWQTKDHIDDLTAIRAKLQDLVTARHETYIWLSAAELVGHLGDEWTARWQPRLGHVFPTREPYEPIANTANCLRATLDRYDQGYVVLTGSPGSGKSTLLIDLLRADDRVAARYYAYVPDNDSILRGEASAFLHDLYLAISGRRGRLVPAPRGNSLDLLRTAFREELKELGEKAHRNCRTEIVLVDGLDHVERDPAPHHSLLSELPPAEEIPDGVVFVIGTRSVGDLPAHVARGVRDERHVELEPLSRAAVLRLSGQAGLPELGERVFELSAGHPLLAQTYIALTAGLDSAERVIALARLPPSGGEVWDFYESVWTGLNGDADVVALLAVVCRLRGTIRLSWLNQTGVGHGEVERLQRLDYLFERSGSDRWTFFHSSFREFLRRRTAEVGGEFNEQLDRSHHNALADRCRSSGPDAPERFDRLFHLLKAGIPDAVLAEATPIFFREQLDGLRTREAVRSDIQLAATALADCNEPMGVVRLALAAHELRVRDYQFPENVTFLELLVAIGQPELAIAHVAGIDNATAGNDRESAAMRLAFALHNAGLVPEASRLFELYEPLEWFGARRAGHRGPWGGSSDLLTSWARAAAVLHGSSYVLKASAALRSPLGLDEHDRYSEDEIVHLRGELIWVAAIELFHRDRIEEVSPLRAELDRLGTPTRDAFTLLGLYLAGISAANVAEELSMLTMLDVDHLPDWGRIEMIERLLKLGDKQTAHELFAQLPVPALPERDYTRLSEEEPSWNMFYRYWRLTVRFGSPPDPVQAVPIPEKDYLEQVVLAGRHVVAFAVLEGRYQVGQSVAGVEIVAALQRMHAFWSTKAGHDEYRRPGPARALVGKRAIALARQLGPDAVREVFAYFRGRWNEQPVHLWQDGTDLIGRFMEAGIGQVSIRAALADLETFHGQAESAADDWISVGEAWVRAGDLNAAARCCKRAVRSTLALTSEKDLQLGTWTRLLVPLMDGPEGERLASEFASALTALSQQRSGGSPDHAVRILIELTVSSHPLRAWDLAKGFLESNVLNPAEVIEAFLTATATKPGVQWWVTVSELLVAIGVEAPFVALQTAARSDPAAARRWLPLLLERVAVEGRPSSRSGWRSAVRDAAFEVGAELAINDSDLQVGDETPARRSVPESESESEPEPSVESLLQMLEARNPHDYFGTEPGRKLIRRLDELDDVQLGALESCLAGTDDESQLRVALAARATTAGDIDQAYEQGARAIAVSRAGDWSRNWAGGPMLKLIPRLRAIDRERTIDATFSRFAELATSVEYFLGQVGSELADYADVFDFPQENTAREVLAVVAALLRDVAQFPDPSSFSVHDVYDPAASSEVALAFEHLVGWFLASPYTIAWQAAQRALMTLVGDGAGLAILEVALDGAEEEVLRVCALIEKTAADGEQFNTLVPALDQLTMSESLPERAAAVRCLKMLGRPLPAIATQPAGAVLPAALRLELPPRGQPRSIVSGIAEMAGLFRSEVERLADVADIDADALFEYVLARAERLAGAKDAGDDRMSREGGILGWGFIKPSAQVVRRAFGQIAAELVDAGRVAPLTALSAARLLPLYDTVLLGVRPVRRPGNVATFVPHDQRSALYKLSLEEIAANAEARLARSVDDWLVIGERCEVALLDRAGHHEHRWSGLFLDRDDGDRLERSADGSGSNLARIQDGGSLVHDLLISTADLYRRRPFAKRLLNAQAIVGSRSIPPVASPSGWLGLHPILAGNLGLDPDPADPFAWLLNGEPAVRSLWWRSGYERWEAWSDTDEVGEGWLVLGSPEVVERLRQMSEWRQAWFVATAVRGEKDVEEREIRASGERGLTEL